MSIGDFDRRGLPPSRPAAPAPVFGRRRSEPTSQTGDHPATAAPPAAPPPRSTSAAPAAPAAPVAQAPDTPASTADSQEMLQIRRLTANHIDAFLASVGVVEPCIDSEGWRHIRLGSASGRVGVISLDEAVYLQVEAFVMDMPSDRDLILPLMRELLELNYLSLIPARAAIAEDKVFITLTWPASVLDAGGVADCIHAAMVTADDIDDRLIEKYGGTVRGRSPFAASIA